MSSSKIAKKASFDNESKNFDKSFDSYYEKKKSITSRYKDSGTSGKEQMKKELLALEKKWGKQTKKRIAKGMEDDTNIAKYGKDAMKGRGFAQYNKGGMVKSNCGASMKPNGRAKK
jgi:hypothetical protein